MYRNTTTIWRLNGAKVAAGTPGATCEKVVSKKWYGSIGGRSVALHENKATALSMMRKLEADAISGRLDPMTRARRVKLDAALLAQYEAFLNTAGLHPDYAKNQLAGAKRIIDGLGFRTAADLIGCGGRVGAWLAGLRSSPGNGHKGHTPKPISAGSRRRLRAAIQGFARFLADRGVLPEESRPVIRLPKGSSEPHVALTLDEVARLLEATKIRAIVKGSVISRGPNKGEPWKELCPFRLRKFEASGRARHLLYRFALVTAMRGDEIKRLTVQQVDFENSAVVLDASGTKTKQGAILPLPASLLEDLREHVARKAPTAPLFHMPGYGLDFKKDCAFAGLSAGGRGLLTFRSLRTTASTLADMVGASTTARQAMLRHSTPILTNTRYLQRGADAQREALKGYWEALPTG
jgi:integrase